MSGCIGASTGPGRRAFWNDIHEVRLEVYPTSTLRFSHPLLDAILASDVEGLLDEVCVPKGHRGLLYVDEVNLLPDHLVDLLLDVAASGINHVERDGISHRHEVRDRGRVQRKSDRPIAAIDAGLEPLQPTNAADEIDAFIEARVTDAQDRSN